MWISGCGRTALSMLWLQWCFRLTILGRPSGFSSIADPVAFEFSARPEIVFRSGTHSFGDKPWASAKCPTRCGPGLGVFEECTVTAENLVVRSAWRHKPTSTLCRCNYVITNFRNVGVHYAPPCISQLLVTPPRRHCPRPVRILRRDNARTEFSLSTFRRDNNHDARALFIYEDRRNHTNYVRAVELLPSPSGGGCTRSLKA